MRLTRRSFVTGSMAVGMGACVSTRSLPTQRASEWSSHSWGPRQTRHNPAETGLNREWVRRLAPAWSFKAGSGITGTPAVVGERIFVASWDGALYALDRRSGALQFRHEVGVRTYPPDRALGIFASPAVADGRVFVASDRIVALSASDGSRLWERVVGDPDTSLEYFWAPPVVYGKRLYAGVSAGSETVSRGQVVCLDAATGELIWRFYTVPEAVAGGALIAPPSLDVHTGTLYLATGNPFHEVPGPMAHACSLVALDAATGALRWADQVHPHDVRNLDLNCPPMLVDLPTAAAAARRLVVVGGKDGMRAWDRESRQRLWHVQLTPPISPGQTQAQATNGPEAGPSAAAGDRVFFASNNHDEGNSVLASLGAADGTLRWQHTLPAFQFAPMSVAGDLVFMGTIDGRLRAWHAGDGELLWTSPQQEPIAGGPAIAGGMVYVGTGAGEFLPGRQLLAFAPVP